MKIKEIVYLPLNVYRLPDGDITCRLSEEQQCPYLGSRNFGQVSVCMLGEQRDIRCKGDPATTYLKPHSECEILKLLKMKGWCDVIQS